MTTRERNAQTAIRIIGVSAELLAFWAGIALIVGTLIGFWN